MRWIRQLAWVLLLGGCASGLNRPIVTVRAKPDAQGLQRVIVHMHSFYFEPNRIEVRANHPVELEVQNKARFVPHEFMIDDPTLHVRARAWLGSARVRFTPTKAGTYQFMCHVDGHAKKGMTGTLVVTP